MTTNLCISKCNTWYFLQDGRRRNRSYAAAAAAAAGVGAVVAGPAAVVNAGIVIFLQHLIYSHTVGKQISLENKNEQVPIYQLALN
jgi:hypothetical protein